MKIDPQTLSGIKKHPHKLGQYLGYNKLTEVHSDWIRNAWSAKDTYVIQAHRNSYKTTAIDVVGPIWYLLFNPNCTILIIRKTETGASATVQEITKHLLSHKIKVLYKACYGIDFEIKNFTRSKVELPTKMTISKEYSIESFGIGGSITGSHFDVILCDDIITLKDRASKSERERTKAFIMELKNIVKPGGLIIYTGTPWHSEDGFSILPPAVKYPLGSISIPELSPERISDIRQSMSASLFAANYLLKHIADEDKIFTDVKYRDWNMEIPCQAYIDPAYKGTHCTALAIAQKHEGTLTVCGYAWRQDITELYEKIKVILNSHNCGTAYIESNADHGLSKTAFEKIYPAVQSVHEKTNKHQKILSFLKGNWSKVYFTEDCQETFLSQILEYEEGEEPDDSPDALASLIRQMGFKDRIMSMITAEDTSEEYIY